VNKHYRYCTKGTSRSTQGNKSSLPRRFDQHRRGFFVERLEDRYLLAANVLFGAAEIATLAGYDISTAGSTVPIFSPGMDMERNGTIQPSTVQSSPLINLDDFRADPRFGGINGSGFSSVIIDGGIDLNHPFFGPDLDSNGIADRIVFQYDFSGANDSNASDVDGHGSNVSSIVGSSDGTFTGMAPGTGIIALKVFEDSGSGVFGDVEEALQWVVANAAAYNIASVNMSLGDTGNYNSATSLYGIGDELAALAAQDVIVVSAAGNDYSFYQSPGVSYPAADPNSLAVGAVWDANNGGPYFWSGGAVDFSTGADRLVSFSQRSTTMTEIFAPGAFITGAGASGEVTEYAGTSQATPHITGIATLAQDLAAEVIGRRLTLSEFTTLLTTTATTIFDGDNEDDNVANTSQNYGRVDVMALAEAILALEVPGIDITTTDFSVSPIDLLAAGGTVTSNFTIRNIGDTDSGGFNVRFYLSDDAFIDPLTDLPLTLLSDDPNYNAADPGAYRIVSGLLAESSTLGAAQLVVPSTNPFGTDSRHYIGIVVDADDENGEANEANNANKGEGVDRQQVNYGSTIAAFPFFEDWEAGTAFAGYWETNPGVEGRIQITPNHGPYGGNYHVTLDDTVDGSAYSLNQLVLHVDLAGQVGVKLDYALKSFGDEEDALDSLDISVDGGATWYQVTPLTVSAGSEGYEERSYLLDSLGLSYSDDTLIRFQQYDNYGIGSDGLAIDNIRLSSIYGSISGQKYQDENRNEIKDPSEQGLAGWTIYLDQNFDSQMVTSGGVDPDSYDAGALLNDYFTGVTFTALGGSSPDVYAGPPQGGFASTGSLAFTRNGPYGWSGSQRLRIDFDSPKNSVSIDAIADDFNDYGILEAYDQFGNFITSYLTGGLGVGGVETMTVFSSSPNIAYVIASGVYGEVINLDNLYYEYIDPWTVTDENGNYSFTQLDSGNYVVQEVLQYGWEQISGGYYVFVAPGQNFTDLDFGNYPLSGSIQGRKWDDLDGDGVMDFDEPGLPGWTIFLDENENGILEQESTNFVSTDVPRGIFDYTTTYSTIAVAGLQAVTDLNLTLNISHTFTGDMTGHLVSPQGTRVGLFFYVGGSGNNFSNTTFDDEAFTFISSGIAPFSGSYIPDQLLSAFDGENPNGVWTLEISDQAGGDSGSLNSWSLDIKAGEQSAVTDFDGYYSFANIRPGTHTVSEVAQPGWIQTYPTVSLAGTRDNLGVNSSNITAWVPNRFDFSEGAVGVSINDGGNDMYDDGNILNTNLASFINYTNGVIVAGDGLFGPGSQYFTAKYQGLFVMGASGISIDSFILSGNNGADGGGAVDVATLSTTVNGQQYTIFVKRVYNAFDPSINEIIMVPGDGTGISHLFSPDTNNGYHEVSGLADVDEIYYALVARNNGGYLTDTNIRIIAEEFLANIAVDHSHHVLVGPGGLVTGIDFGNQYIETPVMSADFDEDGDVDGRDFMAWQRGGDVVAPTHGDGDADGDGDVDSGDLGIWHEGYGASASVALVAPKTEDDIATAFPQRLLLSSEEEPATIFEEPQAEASPLASSWWLSSEERVEVKSFVEAEEPYLGTAAADDVFERWDVTSDWDDEFGDISTSWREDFDEPVEGEIEELMAAVFGG
jgi:subtilisin-like proprotein convertase family protein/uncharacterized protein (DUF2141 family)